MADTPSWNPSDISQHTTLSDSNKHAELGDFGDGIAGARSNLSKSSGKWYAEVYRDNTSSASSDLRVCVAKSGYTISPVPDDPSSDADVWAYSGKTGEKEHNGSSSAYGDLFCTSDYPVIGIALDLDNGKLYFSVNGVWQDSGDPVAGTGYAYTLTAGDYYIAITGFQYHTFGIDKGLAQFEEADLTYTPPTGFEAIYSVDTNDLAGNLPGLTGSLHGLLDSYIDQNLPALTGGIAGSSVLAGTFGAITGSMSSGIVVEGTLPGVTGSMEAGNTLDVTLKHLTGTISAVNNTIIIPNNDLYPSTLHHITGSMRTGARLSGEAPALTGGIVCANQLVGELPAVTGAITAKQGALINIVVTMKAVIGSIVTSSELPMNLTGALPALRGLIQGTTGDVLNIDKNLPAIQGRLVASGANIITTNKNLPAVGGSISILTGNSLNIAGDLSFEGSIYILTGDVLTIEGNTGITGLLTAHEEGRFDDVIIGYEENNCG